jgi:predicted transcriptional regulator
MAASVKIDEALKRRIDTLARQRDRSAHWIMREAIRQYVDREEARDSFHQEALTSWKAYRENGRHLTGEEVAQWLGRWGAEADGGPPDCHG